MFEIAFVVLLFVLALGLAFVAWSIVVAASGSAKKHGHGALHWLFYAILFSLAISTLLSPRSFEATDTILLDATRHPAAKWVSRLVSLYLVVAASERLFSWLIQPRERDLDRRGKLIIAFAAYWTTNVALPALYGARPALSHEFLYPLFIGIGVLSMSPIEARKAVLVARNALLLFVLASFSAALVRTDLVLDRTYLTGLIPGMSFRFAGLAPHANSMGSLAAFALLLLWAHPLRWRSLTAAGWLLAGAALLTSQSKTAWLAFVVAALAMLFFRHGTSLKRALGQREAVPAIAIVLVVAMVIATAVSVKMMFGDGFDKVARFLQSRQGGDLLTLTGRFDIWQVAIEEWRRNPIFGYGPMLWDLQYKISIGILYAAHAHNQFFNVLAMAGTVGAAGFISYFVMIAAAVVRTAAPSAGLSAALFLVIALRSVTEVPLSILRYGPEQLVHFLLLVVVVANWHEIEIRPRPLSTVPAQPVANTTS